MERKKHMIECYDRIYSENGCFKEKWDGKIAIEYKVPKYLRVFFDCFKGKPPMRVLELGAGNGEVSELIKKKNPGFIKSYVATEISKEGVKKLKEQGFKAYQTDAQDLSRFKDNSYDLVFVIDVMHHVSNPRKMAREMMRVSSKYIFLIEANGICIIRKVMERISKKYQAAGENSYTPWAYKSFFKGAKQFSIRPFLFMIPFTPKRLMKPVIWLSETMEKIPLLRWQGSGVVMCGEV